MTWLIGKDEMKIVVWASWIYVRKMTNMYIVFWIVRLKQLFVIVVITIIVVVLNLVVDIKVSTLIYDIHMLSQSLNDGGFHVM